MHLVYKIFILSFTVFGHFDSYQTRTISCPFLQKCQAPLHGTETKSIKLQKFREFLQSCHLCIT